MKTCVHIINPPKDVKDTFKEAMHDRKWREGDKNPNVSFSGMHLFQPKVTDDNNIDVVSFTYADKIDEEANIERLKTKFGSTPFHETKSIPENFDPNDLPKEAQDADRHVIFMLDGHA